MFLSLVSISELKLNLCIKNEYNHLQEISYKVETYIKSNKKVHNLLNKNEYFVFEIKQDSKIFTYKLYSYVNINIIQNYKVEINGFFDFYKLDILYLDCNKL